MTPEEYLFKQYRGKRILLDANLLLLYLVGTFERARIVRFKRTATFTEADFDLLVGFVGAFRTIVTTPHLLTEVSSLANSLPEYIKSAWAAHFALQTSELLEIFEPAIEVMRKDSFEAFGLADAAIHSASDNTLILTEDYRLSGFLLSEGIAVVNLRDLIGWHPV